MDFPIRATVQYLGDDIEALFQAYRHCKQLFPTSPWLSLSQKYRRAAQPSEALLQPALVHSCLCRRVRPDGNMSTWRQPPPADRQVAETTAELAERTATHIRNR